MKTCLQAIRICTYGEISGLRRPLSAGARSAGSEEV
jgi:hypothetical protein